MKKFLFILLNLLQVYAILPPYPEFKTDFKGACPEPDYNQVCGCDGDYSCKEDEACCYNYWCGISKCRKKQPICPLRNWHPDDCATPEPTCDPTEPLSCPPGQECCFNGCTNNCVFLEQCPIEDDSECDGVFTFICNPQAPPGDCSIDENCCLVGDCIYDCIPKPECQVIDPSDNCPTTTTTESPNICYDYNNEFGECGDDVCCYNGCGEYTCVEPDFGCDPNYYWDSSACNGACLYGGENECPYGFACCYDGCEHSCVEPDYFKVSCPNDSIIEHEDVWTKFCLSDCNCPDYQLCCDSPCDCDLNICRDFVVQSTSCPGYCDYDPYTRYCSSDEECIGENKLCCSCPGGISQCVTPLYGPPEPAGLWVPIPTSFSIG